MIVSAAIRYPSGDVVAGFDRHYKIIALQAGFGVISKEGAEHGFLNHKDEFLTREEAKKEAIADGQIKPDHEGDLYSEDIWREDELVGGACD